MTPQKLAELRQQTEKALEKKLQLNHIANDRGLTDISYYDKRLLNLKGKKVSILATETDILTKLQEVLTKHKLNKGIGLHITMNGYTTPIGRADYFDRLEFSIRWYVVKHEVSIHLVSELTKKALTNIVRPKNWKDNNYSEFILDCSLMTLFKEGTITMDEVILKSNEDCEL